MDTPPNFRDPPPNFLPLSFPFEKPFPFGYPTLQSPSCLGPSPLKFRDPSSNFGAPPQILGSPPADWEKSAAQRQQEELLLEELVALVNRRDELLRHLDEREQA